MNFLPARIISVAGGKAVVEAPEFGPVPLQVALRGTGVAAGTMVTLGFRPEHADVGAATGAAGTVKVVEQLGSVSYLYVDMQGGAPVTVEQRRLTSIRPGDAVSIVPETEHLMLFGADGGRL
jgi:ABC-type sugar transport system ATPase subunit